MEHYLIDTNVVSDYFSASLSVEGIKFMDSVIDATPNLSVITQIELLCWKTESLIEQKTRDFISDCIIFDITPDVVYSCVELRKNKKIKTPDAIIAATAMANNFILITNNEKDFVNIQGLKFVNPHKL